MSIGAINQWTSLYGLFGNPVRHSFSPTMHQAAFSHLGVNAVYLAFEIEKGKLKEAVEAIRALSMGGVNVTIPYKVEIIPFLDEVDEEAARIGAVNTIVNRQGVLKGYNTDGVGYSRSLEEAFHPNWKEMEVVILGAGGAVRSVAYTLAGKGIKGMTLINRDLKKAEALASLLSTMCRVTVEGWDRLHDRIRESNLLINGTPIGMHPYENDTPVPKESLHPGLIVSDLIYTPYQTRLLHEAEEIGARIHHGLKMLLYQGAISFELWTGLAAPVKVMERAVRPPEE